MQENRVIYANLLDVNNLLNEVCRDEQDVAETLAASANLFVSLYPTILQTLRKELDNET